MLATLLLTLREGIEAGLAPGIDNEYRRFATEPYGPEGEWDAWFTYPMVPLPPQRAQRRA